MSCGSRQSCAGCSCDGNGKQAPTDIEDCQAELQALREKTKQLESKLASLTSDATSRGPAGHPLRSSRWFNNESNPGMTALYIERYLNYGLTREELMSGKPVIGIAQSGSDLSPCNRHHLELAKRVREGIRSAGGIAFEFPTHPIQESGKRPTACLDRNLAYLSLVEVLYGLWGDRLESSRALSLFDSAIMKTCVVSSEFRQKFLENPQDPNAFEGAVVVFDGPEDYHRRIEDNETPVDDCTILIMRGTGPLGYPGAAEVVNMHPPGRLLRQGVHSLPCIGDGRQSGTSGSPSILNASPEAAAGGNLAVLRDGDKVRVDLNKRRVDILISEDELQKRRDNLKAKGGYPTPESQTPWQELFRKETDQLSEGMVLREAVKYQRVAQRWPEPRDNH
ncbi:hypothetical protein Plec18170_000402 [Paecilomyces lecythidis]